MPKPKIYSPEVIDSFPLPNVEAPESRASGGARTRAPQTQERIPVNVRFPVRRIARETIGQSLNTMSKKILGSYTFGVMGALSVGTYESGVSGDIRISPDGIVARNINGVTTLSLSGATGNAVFLGEIRAASIITGAVNVGDSSIIIDGANRRIIINDGSDDIILLGYQSGGF